MSTSKTPSSYSLELCHTFDAPREKVFAAWLDPEALKAFIGPSAAYTVPTVELDPRVGGRFRIVMGSPEGRMHAAVGVYREITRPERIVCTWSWENTDEEWSDVGETILTLQFRVKGAGTELILTHELFPALKAKDGHLEGWTGTLGRLEEFFRVAP